MCVCVCCICDLNPIPTLQRRVFQFVFTYMTFLYNFSFFTALSDIILRFYLTSLILLYFIILNHCSLVLFGNINVWLKKSLLLFYPSLFQFPSTFNYSIHHKSIFFFFYIRFIILFQFKKKFLIYPRYFLSYISFLPSFHFISPHSLWLTVSVLISILIRQFKMLLHHSMFRISVIKLF